MYANFIYYFKGKKLKYILSFQLWKWLLIYESIISQLSFSMGECASWAISAILSSMVLLADLRLESRVLLGRRGLLYMLVQTIISLLTISPRKKSTYIFVRVQIFWVWIEHLCIILVTDWYFLWRWVIS